MDWLKGLRSSGIVAQCCVGIQGRGQDMDLERLVNIAASLITLGGFLFGIYKWLQIQERRAQKPSPYSSSEPWTPYGLETPYGGYGGSTASPRWSWWRRIRAAWAQRRYSVPSPQRMAVNWGIRAGGSIAAFLLIFAVILGTNSYWQSSSMAPWLNGIGALAAIIWVPAGPLLPIVAGVSFAWNQNRVRLGVIAGLLTGAIHGAAVSLWIVVGVSGATSADSSASVRWDTGALLSFGLFLSVLMVSVFAAVSAVLAAVAGGITYFIANKVQPW